MEALPIAADSSKAELVQARLACQGCPSDIRVEESGVELALGHGRSPQSKGRGSSETSYTACQHKDVHESVSHIAHAM